MNSTFIRRALVPAAALAIALGASACSPSTTSAGAAKTAQPVEDVRSDSASAKAQAKESKKAEASAKASAKAAADKATADRAYEAWLTERQISSPQELLARIPDKPDGYVSGFEYGTPNKLRITVQENTFTDAELKTFARNTFSLIGTKFPEIEWVEAVSADNASQGQVSRKDVPLLNLGKK